MAPLCRKGAIGGRDGWRPRTVGQTDVVPPPPCLSPRRRASRSQPFARLRIAAAERRCYSGGAYHWALGQTQTGVGPHGIWLCASLLFLTGVSPWLMKKISAQKPV